MPSLRESKDSVLSCVGTALAKAGFATQTGEKTQGGQVQLCPLSVTTAWFYTFSSPTMQVNQLLLAPLLSLTLTIPFSIIEGKH